MSHPKPARDASVPQGSARFRMLLRATLVAAVAVLLVPWPVTAEEADPPAQPSRPVVSALAHDSVTLTWDDPEDATITGYQILRRNPKTDEGGVFTVIKDDTGTSLTSYTDTTVEASTSYFYRIKARNVNGLSARSGFARADTPKAPVGGTTYLGNITNYPSSKNISGSLDTSGASNRYRFTLSRTMTVELKLRAQDADADLVLQDSAAVTLAESRNAGTAGELISKRLEPGTYSVLVKAQENAPNIYRLVYDAVINSSPYNLGNITNRQWDPPLGNYVAANLGGSQNRFDYYKFTLNAPKTVHLQLWTQQSQQGDTDLFLEHEDGTLVTSRQTAGTTDELIETTLTAGTWYVAVRPHTARATASYSLSYGVTAPTELDEGVIDLGNITYLPDAETASGKITSADRLDEYRFTLDLTMKVELNLHALDNFGADLLLKDDAGVTVAESSGVGTTDEWISKQLAPGTYSMFVEGQYAGTTEYLLDYEAVNDSTPLDLGDITDRQWDPLVVGVTSDVGSSQNRLDYYKFTLNAPKTVHLRLWRQPNQQGDTDLYLENDADTVIAASKTVGTADELIETTLTAGTWYVAVRPHAAGGAVSYTLSYGVSAPGTVDETESPIVDNGTYTTIEANSLHACGVRANGTISCWGSNSEGQIKAPAGTFKAIALGSVHSCAIRTDDTIACWGANNFDQTDSPPRTYKSIAANDRTSCAIAIDDKIDCWGYNAFGQADEPSGTFKTVTLGWEHVCALRTDDTIACWGYNDEGEIESPEGTYKAISAGDVHTCAIATDDTLACWGVTRTATPTGTYKSVTAREYHSCAIATDDTLTCWGKTGSGRTDAPTGTYKSVGLGYVHTCAITTDDTLACWGYNGSGQADPPAGTYKSVVANQEFSCGIATDDTVTCWGFNTNARTDAPVSTLKTVAIGDAHGCGIATDDTITCWGDNVYGQTDTPAGTYKTLTVGSYHSCALASDDTITCWGDNVYGQTDTPAGTHKTVVSGYNHICAIASDDTITCWGDSAWGQADAPAGTYKALALSTYHSCALATDGTVTCWGYNYHGQTDTPTGTYKTLVTGTDHVCAIATDDTITCWGRNLLGQADAPTGTYKTIVPGSSHSCAIATDDTITCWGYNLHGQVDAPTGTYKALTTGIFHSCAIATDGTITCWGTIEGPPGSTTDTYKALTTLHSHNCAIATDDTVVCWTRSPRDVNWKTSNT